MKHGWVFHAMQKHLGVFQQSLKDYPPIPAGTLDPYVPPKKKAPKGEK